MHLYVYKHIYIYIPIHILPISRENNGKEMETEAERGS